MTYIARSWAGKNAINSFLRKLLAGKKSVISQTCMPMTMVLRTSIEHIGISI